MTALSKLCDGADWFDPAFERVIRDELEETPRFHRKQWEFAQIFRSLEVHGCLGARARGLSMGGGHERLLYAVVRRAGSLTVTDLYGADSAWPGAQTGDPDASVKSAAPFPIDRERLTVRRMDMRTLEFPDASFDFCYSSCAIEHIGERDDFLRHLREVNRVLTPDGLYVLTTEFHYGDDSIPVPHNFYFSEGDLDDLIREAGMAVAGEADGTLRAHRVNRPLPSNVRDLCADPLEGVTARALDALPHVQLLTGGSPFTSLAVILRRRSGVAAPLTLAGLEGSRRFINDGAQEWRSFVESTPLRLDPFALCGGARPSRHEPRRVDVRLNRQDDTLFHTGYVWLGGTARTAVVTVHMSAAGPESTVAEVRVHAQPTTNPDATRCTHVERVAVCDCRATVSVPVAVTADSSFAVVGKLVDGACLVTAVDVRVV